MVFKCDSSSCSYTCPFKIYYSNAIFPVFLDVFMHLSDFHAFIRFQSNPCRNVTVAMQMQLKKSSTRQCFVMFYLTCNCIKFCINKTCNAVRI